MDAIVDTIGPPADVDAWLTAHPLLETVARTEGDGPWEPHWDVVLAHTELVAFVVFDSDEPPAGASSSRGACRQLASDQTMRLRTVEGDRGPVWVISTVNTTDPDNAAVRLDALDQLLMTFEFS